MRVIGYDIIASGPGNVHWINITERDVSGQSELSPNVHCVIVTSPDDYCLGLDLHQTPVENTENQQ